MPRIVKILTILCLTALLCTACAPDDKLSMELYGQYIVIDFHDISTMMGHYTWYLTYDKDTYVEYVIINEAHRLTITPYYLSDGTIAIYDAGGAP